MKKISTFLCLFFCMGFTLNSFALSPIVNYSIFHTPDQKSYIETYLLIPGSTVTFNPADDGQFQAGVEVVMLFKQGEDIVKFDKYVLNSKKIADNTKVDFDLVDLKRNVLEAGEYDLEINFKDIHQDKKTALFEQKITIEAPSKDELALSSVVLIEKYDKTTAENEYSKNGYDLIPNVANYFPKKLNRLAFYNEIYNSNAAINDDFLVVYSVKKSGTDEVASQLRKFKKYKAAPINVLFSEFDISDLESGNYNLVVEVRNKKNELISHNGTAFQRSTGAPQPLTVDELNKVAVANTFVEQLEDEKMPYWLKSLTPICERGEAQYINNVVGSNDVTLMQQYLYNFWKKRAADDPEAAFAKHQKVINNVEGLYGSAINHGFQTDRGRIHVKYGAPNDLRNFPSEPGSYPYEIWHYYKLNDRQNDVKFVFYKPNLADNDFLLIHSDARGEVKEPRWQLVVSKAREQNNPTDFDNNQVRDHYGTQIKDDF